MKRALINSLEPGRICEIVEPGQEFEVHESFSWIDVPDDTTSIDRYNVDTGEIIKFDPVSIPGFAETGYAVARAIAYTDIGNQLDMLFKELKATGTISNTGPWATHITSVKAAIPKDDPQAVWEWNQQYYQQMLGNVAPQ
jgi:hypothetical protein